MSPIQKVAVLGASGTLGDFVVPALLAAGFTVTAITRPGGRGPKIAAKTVTIVEAPYDDIATLTEALRGQDALVEVFNPAASVHQRTFVRAALAAGVKHLITNEFGLDTFNSNTSKSPAIQTKVQAQQELEHELQQAVAGGNDAQLSWTGIFSGVWYDWAIREGKSWIDPFTRTITRFGSGDQKTSISRGALNGEAVVAVLREPEKFKNRPAYFASHAVSTNELIALVKEVSEDPNKPWTITDVPDMKAYGEEATRLWNEDTANGVEDQLHTQAFVMLAIAALFDENNSFGGDLSDKVEPGWDEGIGKLKDQLKLLINEAGM